MKIAVSGVKGKMGARIAALAKEDPAFELAGAFDIGDDPAPLIGACDCLIDFTTPEAAVAHVALCEKEKKAIVIGTTGLTDDQRAKVEAAAAAIPVVYSPNMSVGVNLMFKMVRDAAKTLGAGYHVEIIEAHHVHKKDSPSGTAKELARIISDARKGHVKVPIESVREGEIVGEHTVTFESPWDTVEITHSAKTRDIFAKGALAAARFAVTKKHGLFTMKDVLKL